MAGIETTCDEDNRVANARLLSPAALAPELAVAELLDEHLQLPADAAGRADGGTKAMTVIGAMLAGEDSIADLDVLPAVQDGVGPHGPPGADSDVVDQVMRLQFAGRDQTRTHP